MNFQEPKKQDILLHDGLIQYIHLGRKTSTNKQNHSVVILVKMVCLCVQHDGPNFKKSSILEGMELVSAKAIHPGLILWQDESSEAAQYFQQHENLSASYIHISACSFFPFAFAAFLCLL